MEVAERMKRYKITRSFTVEAESKADALKKLTENQSEYLDWQSVKEAGDAKTGWGAAVRKQLTGDSKR
jgi:hypothetical protein